MKLLNCILCLTTAGSFVAASPSPHRHHHQHRHGSEVKRSPDNVKVVNAEETVKAYEFNGATISEQEVCDGIKSGKLKFAGGGDSPIDCGKPSAPRPAASSPAAKTKPKPVEAVQKAASYGPPASSDDVPSTFAAPAPPSSPDSPSKSPPASYSSESSEDSDETNSGTGLDREFPDDVIDCSEFPSEYGPIPIPWVGIGGWSGIQYVQIAGGSVNRIDTAIAGGDNCISGAMCSYACPPGYQKTQWPTEQGSTGESVGGLMCNSNGKLVKTNPELSKTLCMKGTGATKVVNKLSTNAAICRTDYPGTESQTVPLNTLAGTTMPLTCPSSSKYYKYQGLPTTAQYYINNKGVPVKDACTWGVDGSHQGNWAPSYLGVGQDTYGKTWLAISTTAQNNPIDYQPLDYTVEIVGDNLSGKCRLRGGKYCSGDNYDNCNDKGCTVQLMSGEAEYHLTD